MMDTNIMPPHLNNTYIRPPGIAAPDLIKYDVPPTNNLTEFDPKGNKLIFTLNTSSNLLDPYALYLDLEIHNDSPNPIQCDNSLHSIISEIAVLSNGVVIEKITDYDFLNAINFDLTLNKKQRRKRRDIEGFGDNRFGTNEIIIMPDHKKHPNKNYAFYKNIVNVYEAFHNGETPSYYSSFSRSDDQPPLIDKEDLRIFRSYGSTASIDEFEKDKRTPYDPLGECLPKLNNWKHVINGKLCPCPENFSTIDEKRHIRKVRLPLMLKTIGFGQQTNNYKLIPLELFGILTIVITLNPDAFFVPKNIKEYEYFKCNMIKKQDGTILNSTELPDQEVQRKYKVKNPTLHTEQYRFIPGVHQRIMEQVKSGGWVLDYVDMEIIDQVYMKNYPTVSYTKAISRNGIKSIYLLFTNDLYKYSPYARKLARYNMGIKNIFFKQAGAQYPPNTNTEHNSLNSFGEHNATYFYNELLKSFSRQNVEDECLINMTNFCVNQDSSHKWALINLNRYNTTTLKNKNPNSHVIDGVFQKQIEYVYNDDYLSYTDKEWTDNYFAQSKQKFIYNSLVEDAYKYHKLNNWNDFSDELESVTSKCIYALNFETAPHSAGLYRTGISTAFNVPFIIEIERTKDYYKDPFNSKSTVYYFQWIIFEYYTTIQLTPSGIFVKS